MAFDVKSVINKFNTMFNSWRTGICCNWNVRTHRNLYDESKSKKGYMWVHHWFMLGLIFPRLRPKGPEEMHNVDGPMEGCWTKKCVHQFRCGDWNDFFTFTDGMFGGLLIGLRWRTHKVESKDYWETTISPRSTEVGDHTPENMVSTTGPPLPPNLRGGENNA